jgi:hypothetical protein
VLPGHEDDPAERPSQSRKPQNNPVPVPKSCQEVPPLPGRRGQPCQSQFSGGAFRSDEDTPANRKLIRPNLAELADRYPTRSFAQRKQVPPEQTNAESYYYLKQMAAKTPMVVVLTDGEEIHGWIEWYDKGCLKVNREKAEPARAAAPIIRTRPRGRRGRVERNR